MRIIPSPQTVIGANVLALWRQTPEINSRFADTEEGVHQFLSYVRAAVMQRIEQERGQ